MTNAQLVQNWQSKIISICEQELGRDLSEVETFYIQQRQAFLALEVLEDSVSNMSKNEIEELLNSESRLSGDPQ